MKPIVILIEGTKYQCSREIEVVMKLGFEVIFITTNLRAYSDECLANITKAQYIIEVNDIHHYSVILNKLKLLIPFDVIHSCLSLSEKGYYAAALLSKLLSVNGINYHAALIFRSKSMQRDLFKNALHFKSPKFQVINIYNFKSNELTINYPLVIKPIALTASTGVMIVNNKVKLESAINNLKSLYKKNGIVSSDALLEEYISGQVISVETLTANYKHICLGITDRIIGGLSESVELGGSFPVNTGLNEKIFSAAYEILNQINLNVGMTHIELILHDNEIYLVEINGRMAGAYVPNMINIVYNTDILEECMKSMLLLESAFPRSNIQSRVCTLRAITADNEGILKEISWPNISNSLKPDLQVQLIKTGCPVKPPADNLDRIAFFIVTDDSETKSKKLAQEYFRQVTVKLDDR